MDSDQKIIHLFRLAHPDVDIDGQKFTLEVVYGEDLTVPVGVNLLKHGDLCWHATRESLVFDYVTRDL